MKTLKTIRRIFGYDEHGNKVWKENIDNIKGIYAIGIDDPIDEEDTIVKTKVGLGGLNEEKEGEDNDLELFFTLSSSSLSSFPLASDTLSSHEFSPEFSL